MELSWQSADYSAAEQYARLVLSDDPTDTRAGWALCGALINQRRFPDAFAALTTYHLEPSNSEEARAWIHVMSLHSESKAWLQQAAVLAEGYSEFEDVASAFIAATGLTPPDDTVPAGTVDEIRRVVSTVLARHANAANWEVIDASNPEQLLARIAEIVSRGADEFAQATLQVRTGSMPMGILSTLSGRSYTEVLLRGAGGCIPIRGPVVIPEEHQAALGARNCRVVADVSALTTGSLIQNVWASVVAYFPSLVVSETQREDALRARDAFALPSAGMLGWDSTEKKITYTETTDEYSRSMRSRSQFVVDQILGQEVVRSKPSSSTTAPEYARSWISAVELAKAQSLVLLADDWVLRAVARYEGVPAFSTLDLLEVLLADSVISADQYREATLELRRHAYVGLPFHRADIEALAAFDNWQGGAAAFQFARPGPWSSSASTLETFKFCLTQVMTLNRASLPHWVTCAAVGSALHEGPDRVNQAAGRLLAWAFCRLDLTPAEVAACFEMTKADLQSLGAFDPIPATAQALCQMLREAVEESVVGPTITHLTSGCEIDVRAVFMQALMDR